MRSFAHAGSAAMVATHHTIIILPYYFDTTSITTPRLLLLFLVVFRARRLGRRADYAPRSRAEGLTWFERGPNYYSTRLVDYYSTTHLAPAQKVQSGLIRGKFTTLLDF